MKCDIDKQSLIYFDFRNNLVIKIKDIFLLFKYFILFNRNIRQISEKINYSVEAGEDLIKKTMEGMREVVKFANLKKVNKYTLVISEEWKYDVFTIISS